ncbi:unnamed protein product [Plutella xylostella]|uniref:(diamondback moth) hypothetical protein n=1 Tax=Plutella xylostella TaxID=51655 RepID=A0A8S4DM01_PLUXY|nr:unnamed protein product [Plutella xylostella]
MQLRIYKVRKQGLFFPLWRTVEKIRYSDVEVLTIYRIPKDCCLFPERSLKVSRQRPTHYESAPRLSKRMILT